MTIGILLLIVAVSQLILGIWFLTRYQKNQATMWYGYFAIGIALYVASNGLGYLSNNFYIAERFGWIGGLMTAIFILPFSYSFPLPKKSVNELLPFIIWPLAVFVPGFLLTNIFVTDQGIIDYRQGYQTLTGPYFWFALTFFGIYWIWGLVNLFQSMQKSDGQHRWQLRMILSGLFVSLIVSVAFDIVLPLVSKSTLGWVGSMFSAIWLGFTSYVIAKK